MAPKPLTKQQIAIISGTVGSAILVGGLVAILVITQKNTAPPVQTAVVKPPITAGSGAVSSVKTQVCAPVSANYEGLVPCEKTSTCTGCVEYTDASNPYSCVTVTGGNNQLLDNGQLATPMPVNYNVPPNGLSCRGHGTYDPASGVCKCKSGFSGNDCELYTLKISTPGSFCLPSYANQCMSPTTDSILMNANTGKGGQFTCACKPEYVGLFAQSVAGGNCDTPLACGASSFQMDATQTSEVKYVVFDKFDESGKAKYVSKSVKPNRITSFNLGALETCYARTEKDTKTEAYETVQVAANADPTCKAQLQSNYCYAAVSDSYDAANIAVRGSNRPGDPLKTRVSPAFFPPVPPALQRCPDGFTGKNTPSSPCVKDGKTLYLMPSLNTECGNTWYDPLAETTFEGTGVWYTSAFDDHGEWNGAFTCVNDLTSAQMRVGGDGESMPVKDAPWRTVDKNTRVEEVDCLNQPGAWLTRNDYDPLAKKYKYADGCAGTECSAALGSRRKDWDGDRDGALMDQDGKPWFASGAGQTFGGQCACDGVQYRGREGTAVKSLPEFLNRYSGKESWWGCGADTCSSAENPRAHLDTSALDSGNATALNYPQCVCNQGDASTSYPIKTQMSYAPQNSMPVCVDDSCNPHGYKTTAKVDCMKDSECVGVCYAEKCYYPRTYISCTNDDGCTSMSNAKVKGRCVSVSLLDPNVSSDAKECIYEDVDRARMNSSCKLNKDCSYGKCVAFENVQGDFIGQCSGGCACDKDTVQQPYASSPLGFRCLERCKVNPCVHGDCVIDPDTNQQKCICKPCYEGEHCEIAQNASRKGQFCQEYPTEDSLVWQMYKSGLGWSDEEFKEQIAIAQKRYKEATERGYYDTCCEEGSTCSNGKCT